METKPEFKEKKINKMLTIHKSVLDEVQKRLDEYGGKLSALVENLLVGWTLDFDKLKKMQSEISEGKIPKFFTRPQEKKEEGNK